jgi:hypothetical protein
MRKLQAGGNGMKHKVGDTVRIRPQKWMDAQKKNMDGSIEAPEGYGVRMLSLMRAMTRWEVLAWAGGEASHGWVVRCLGSGDDDDNDWFPPQCTGYTCNTAEYRRARMLPDGSGIDEESIRGFEVEE